MKKYLIFAGIFLLGILSVSSAFAMPDAEAGGRIIKDKAIHYAREAAKNPGFDFKAASNTLSQNALALGKIYAQDINDKVTSDECLEEIAELGIDSQTFLNKALSGGYKDIAMVNGNFVMLLTAGAGQIVYIAIDRGKYCLIDKSIHDAYWAGKVIHLGMIAVNLAFS